MLEASLRPAAIIEQMQAEARKTSILSTFFALSKVVKRTPLTPCP
jgi:hypothetical protein